MSYLRKVGEEEGGGGGLLRVQQTRPLTCTVLLMGAGDVADCLTWEGSDRSGRNGYTVLKM